MPRLRYLLLSRHSDCRFPFLIMKNREYPAYCLPSPHPISYDLAWQTIATASRRTRRRRCKPDHPKRCRTPLHLTLLPLPLSDLGRETSLDTSHRTTGSARIASNEVKTILSLVELCVGRAARLARYVLDNVPTQYVLDLFLGETTLDDQTPAAVYGTAGTQFGEQELRHMLIGTLHTLADFGDVGEDSLEKD